jgi:hypothetical protein
MYIYSRVSSYIAVGGTKTPLLCSCPVQGQFGETVHATFSRPFYVPVLRRGFGTTLINKRDELGQAMPFEFGKTVATLHFGRRYSLSTLGSHIAAR